MHTNTYKDRMKIQANEYAFQSYWACGKIWREIQIASLTLTWTRNKTRK